MLMLSDFYFSIELWSFGCVSAVCDANNEWYFWGTDKKWFDKIPDVYLGSLGSNLDFPKKIRQLTKR